MNRKQGQVVRRDSFWEQGPRGGMYDIWLNSVLESDKRDLDKPAPKYWLAVAALQHSR